MLLIDESSPLRVKVPNRLQLDGQIFVGGLPNSSHHLLDNSVRKSEIANA